MSLGRNLGDAIGALVTLLIAGVVIGTALLVVAVAWEAAK